MKKREILVVRCSKKTKKLWNEVLYEMKKRGWTADDVLYEALLEFKDSAKYLEGKVY